MLDVPDTLVGRGSELQELDGALVEALTGPAGPILLEGEPGIGKTSLLRELASRADAHGCLVFEGAASELERDLPFWLLVDALDEYLAGQDPRLVSSLPAETRAELSLVLPAMRDASAGSVPEALQDERYRTHRAVRELLERLAATRPVVLLFDDVHWADSESVELLATLVRNPPDARVLVVVASRLGQVPGRLRSALEWTDRRRGITRVELRGLSRDAAVELLTSDIAASLADELFEESGGNPFYLTQLARARAASAAVREADTRPSTSGVPPAVMASLTEEVAALPAGAQQLLRGAAVAGDPFEIDMASVAAGLEEAASMDALDGLLQAGLVRTTDIPRRFRFRHPLVRHAVYEGCPGGWALGAHGRCAEALAAAGRPAIQRAHHVEFAARPGDLDAVAVLAEAGADAMLRAPGSAVRWFGAAERLLPGDAAPEQRVELLLPRARALAANGHLRQSHDDLLTCLGLIPGEAEAQRAQIATTCAGVERLLGRHDDSHERLLATLAALRDRTTRDGVTVMLELAVDGLFRADPPSVVDWASTALRTSRDLADRPLVAASAAMLALGTAVAGNIAPAQTAYDEAAGLVADLADAELAERVDAAAYLTSAATYLDRYDDAVVVAERALRVGRAAGRLHPTLLPALGAAHLMRGRLDVAAAILDDGIEAARLAGVTQAISWMLRNRSFVAAAAGDARTALELAQEAVELTEELDESVLSAWAAMALARAAVMADRPGDAIAVLGGGASGLEPVPGAWRLIGLEALATAFTAEGRLDEAREIVVAAQSHAGVVDLPMAHAWADRAAAVLALREGAHGPAAEAALRSAAHAEDAGAVVEAALSRLAAGRALAAGGDADAAAAELTRAAEVLGRCGALPHRDAAEQELRRLGRPVHRRTRSGRASVDALASLSEREREITDLVVDRRTNAEIAAELFLSPKTVETHLRNVFRKLGVSSRVELARLVERAREDG